MKKTGKGVIIFLIVLTILLLLGMVKLTYILTKENVNRNELFLSSCLTGIEFIGTMVLGIVAFWQTKEANAISTLLIEKETEIQVNWLSPITFCIQTFNPFESINFSKKYPMEGVICTEQDGLINEFLSFLEINIPFELVNGSFEKAKIESVGFNKNLDSTDESRLLLNILNVDERYYIAFNPNEQKYNLKFYVNCDFNKLIKMNNAGMFVFDFDIIFYSKYNTAIKYTIQQNFEKISCFNNLLKTKKKKIENDLDDMLITKEKYNAK